MKLFPLFVQTKLLILNNKILEGLYLIFLEKANKAVGLPHFYDGEYKDW